ncbi:MAG: protein kinase [Acidobacteria bacterium]|nr:protein kinase [Acidobacteriota bacterium]
MNEELWRPFVGEWIEGAYKLCGLLGAGSFGGVFQADHIIEGHLLRRVAVKLIPAAAEGFSEQIRELTAATVLRHPHLLTAITAGKATLRGAGLIYLVMELAEETLADRLRRGPLTLQETVTLTRQIASALDHLHNRTPRIVHRDLKPANILWVEGVWKLSDFGTVRSIGDSSASHTRRAIGSLPYMPPESFDGEVSPAWDVWSLGVAIQVALTGRFPFEAPSENELILQIYRNEPRISPTLPSPFLDVVRGCVTKDRRSRWTLDKVLRTLDPVAAAAPMRLQAPRSRSRRPLLAGVGAIAMAAAAGVGSYYIRQRTKPQAPAPAPPLTRAADPKAWTPTVTKRKSGPPGTTEKQPSTPELLGRAKTSYEAGRYDEAKSLYQEVLRLQPGHTEARTGLDRVNRAQAAELIPGWLEQARRAAENGQYAEAEQSYQKVLGLQPGHSEARNGLDRVRKARGIE